jgi:hypothetical protein
MEVLYQLSYNGIFNFDPFGQPPTCLGTNCTYFCHFSAYLKQILLVSNDLFITINILNLFMLIFGLG